MLQIIGRSKSIQEVMSRAERFAAVPRPILIRGERGTGKELLAHLVHKKSHVSDGPFIPINCAVYNDELLASELFGHERGAFTGADKVRIGCLERANGGTLFFDEVGNMTARFQEKMLRVIEAKQFQRVGSNEQRSFNARLIFATNADLESMMSSGEFRHDFYDRIAFETLVLPPLRQRKSDIPLLVSYFSQLLMEEIPNFEPKYFSPAAVKIMMEYYWPGNIRELKNVVERLQIKEGSDMIHTVDLPQEITASAPMGETFEEKVEAYKRHLIISAWRDAGYSQKRASEALGMTYDQFRHYYRKYNLKDLID